MHIAESFVPGTRKNPQSTLSHPRKTTPSRLYQETDEKGDGDDAGMSQPETTVYNILEDMHNSNFPFRLVVVGNGAILETTSSLGPVMKMGKSPRTGENLVTFSSEDKSFEFHVMIAQVSKVVMTQKEGAQAGKVLDIFRFLTADGKPMCSLILSENSDDGKKWFSTMLEKYNNGDVQL